MIFSPISPWRAHSGWRAIGVFLMASALTVSSASAQIPLQASAERAVDPRFQPWLGCWSPSTEALLPPPDGAPAPSAMACLVPSRTIARSVDVVLFDSAGMASRSAIPLPGSPTAKRVDDCTGAETATWSADERRLVLRADLVCEGGVSRVETGLLTMAPSGEWLQVQHLAVAGNAVTTVARMRFRDDAAARYATLGGGRAVSRPSLRLATGAPVTAEKVLDVANKTPEALTEAWLAELGQRFAFTGQQLRKLADGGMPARIMDLMVAVSHPEAFQLRTASNEFAGDRFIGNQIQNNMSAMGRCGGFDDFCYGPGGMGAWGLGMGRFGGWDPYMLGFGQNAWGFGGSPFGGGFGLGNGMFFGNAPVIIVNRPSGGEASAQGRLVRGRGYTRERSSEVGSPSPTRATGGSSGGASGGGSAGSSTGRTAKPRGGGGL